MCISRACYTCAHNGGPPDALQMPRSLICRSQDHEQSRVLSAYISCRASLASLPLLGQAIGTLPLGTWSSQSLLVQRENNGLTQASPVTSWCKGFCERFLHCRAQQGTTCYAWHAGDQCICPAQGEERRDRRKVGQLHTVQPTTPLTTALSMLLEAGVSVLPIVDAVSLAFNLTLRLMSCTGVALQA